MSNKKHTLLSDLFFLFFLIYSFVVIVIFEWIFWQETYMPKLLPSLCIQESNAEIAERETANISKQTPQMVNLIKQSLVLLNV